jgi:hypothetical protein
VTAASGNRLESEMSAFDPKRTLAGYLQSSLDGEPDYLRRRAHAITPRLSTGRSHVRDYKSNHDDRGCQNQRYVWMILKHSL